MELIFADESGKDSTRATFVIVASVCFNEEWLSPLETHIRDVKRRYGIPQGYELHWLHRTYKPRLVAERGLPERRLTAEQHAELRRDFLSFLNESEATVVVAAYAHDLGRQTVMWRIGTCLESLAERAQMHLQDLGRQQGRRVLGLLVADEPGSRDETAEIAERLRSLHRNGSLFIETFDTLVMNSFLYPSDLVPGLQLADFVAGAADWALNRGYEDWWQVLSPHVRRKRGTTTRMLGYGLKIWPPVSAFTIGATTIK
jgi:hypothetical protein